MPIEITPTLLEEETEYITGFIRRNFYRLLKMGYDLEDLAQEVKIDILQSGNGKVLPSPEDMRRWMARIIRNRMVDLIEYEEAAKRPRPNQIGEVEVGMEDNSQDPAIRHDELKSVFSQFGKLTKKQRDAITYHFLGQMKFDEMAKRFGGTPDSWRVSCNRGIRELKGRLKVKSPFFSMRAKRPIQKTRRSRRS